VDKVEDLVDKVESKHKIDLFTFLLTPEDNELIKIRREYHLNNASSSDIKIIPKTIVKEVESEPKKMHLDNYKNIVMDESTMGALGHISSSINEYKNLNANFETEKIEENKNESDKTNANENAVVEPKYSDHICAINKLRPQLTASKL
jgi:hypothetical protein